MADDDTLRHHPLRPGHVDAPHRAMKIGDLRLERGGVIEDCRVSYVTHGTPSPRRDNVVLVLTAIGSTHHRLDFLIGPALALDPARWFVVVADALGNGLSTSPSNASPRQRGPAFPRFTIRDMVQSQRLLLDALGIDGLAAVVGASMGGMQALQWGVSHAEAVRAVVALTPMAKTSTWSQLVNEAARRALTSDPAWTGGAYTRQPEAGWRLWSLVVRGLATRTPAALASLAQPLQSWIAALESETLAEAVDANDWIAQSHAYDAHDVGTTPGFDGDTRAALASIRARTLIMAPPLDLYNPTSEARDASAAIPGAAFVEIPSPHGHQAATTIDPRAVAFINATAAAFLA